MTRLAMALAPWAIALAAVGAACFSHQTLRETRAHLAECAAYVTATEDADDAIHSLPDDPDDLRDWLRGLAAR